MKDAYWLQHDSNAKDDPKCMLLIEDLGLEGYGVFWVLIEYLRDQPDYRCSLSMGIQNRNNAMFFATGIDNSGLREDAEEGKKIIKGMTDSVVSEGKKMSESFKPTAAVQTAQQIKSKIEELKLGIKQTESDVKSLQSTFEKASPGKAKMFALGELNAAKKALQEDKVALAELDAQHNTTSTTAQRLTSQIRALKDEMAKMAMI